MRWSFALSTSVLFHCLSSSHSLSLTCINICEYCLITRSEKAKTPAHLIESTIYVITQINTFILEKFLVLLLTEAHSLSQTKTETGSWKIQIHIVFNFMFDDIKGKLKASSTFTIVQPVKAVDVNCRKSLLKN